MAKEKSNDALPPGGKWFEKIFDEHDGSETRDRKKKFIECFYRGYLHAFNDAHPNQPKFEITNLHWTLVPTTTEHGKKPVHKVEVYIFPPPSPVPLPPPPPPPAGVVSDPPDPTKPPPEME